MGGRTKSLRPGPQPRPFLLSPFKRGARHGSAKGYLDHAGEALLALCQRTATPLAVLNLELRAEQDSLSDRPAEAERLIGRVRSALRKSDLVIEAGPATVAIVCPDTDRDGLRGLTRRLAQRFGAVVLNCASAVYPIDGYGLRDLFTCVHQRRHVWSVGPMRSGETGEPDDPGEQQGPSRPADASCHVAATRDTSYRRYRLPRIGWARASMLALKPVVERGLVLAALPLWGAVMGLCWALVKLSDPAHPAIFVQERTGLGGRRFRLFKIRTMVPGAHLLQSTLAAYNLHGDRHFKMKNDPRITRIGRVLRKTYLDELPQLINVLKGEMSLVGPRPCSTAPEEHEPWELSRTQVLPGLTGPCQLTANGLRAFSDKARIEIDYVRRQSFVGDLRILFGTLALVGGGKGL